MIAYTPPPLPSRPERHHCTGKPYPDTVREGTIWQCGCGRYWERGVAAPNTFQARAEWFEISDRYARRVLKRAKKQAEKLARRRKETLT